MFCGRIPYKREMANTINTTTNTSIIVQKYRIIGTNTVCYSAWEPSSYTGPHHTLTTIDGKVYGQVSTLRIPPEIDALPCGWDRSDACARWYADQYERSYAAIVAAHPEAAAGVRDGMGGIEIRV